MDKRCPRKLKGHPKSWCPLAVMRLKALRNAGRELTEEEEGNLPGCPWAVNHQLASYCFFNYISKFMNSDEPPSESEIAHFNNLSKETVKKLIKKSISKIRTKTSFKEIIDSHDGDSIMTERDDQTPYNIID